ncbi:helix-turn-helix domain-containing protein [Chloroflexota bacterium]
MNADSLVMTIPEVAKVLGISRGLAYDLARRNELPVPVIKVGRRLLISSKLVERLLSGENFQEVSEGNGLPGCFSAKPIP